MRLQHKPWRWIAAVITCACLFQAMPILAQDRCYELVWADEFDGTEIDLTKWGFEVNGWGGGNKYRSVSSISSTGSNDIVVEI